MARAAITVVIAMATLACSGKDDAPAPAPVPPPTTVVHDAGVDGITAIGTFDPGSDMHLDDEAAVPRMAPSRPKNRQGRPIDIMLKTTPPGAIAAVDGVPIGYTPAYWFGEADGREHEFTFTRAGYAGARFRFVPITSGVVHATLDAIATDPSDGGLGPMIAPTFAPDASVTAPSGAPVPGAPARTTPPPPSPADAAAAQPLPDALQAAQDGGALGPTP